MGDTHVRKFVMMPSEALSRLTSQYPSVHRTAADTARREMGTIVDRDYPDEIKKVQIAQKLIELKTQKEMLERPLKLGIFNLEQQLQQLQQQQHHQQLPELEHGQPQPVQYNQVVAPHNVDDDDGHGGVADLFAQYPEPQQQQQQQYVFPPTPAGSSRGVATPMPSLNQLLTNSQPGSSGGYPRGVGSSARRRLTMSQEEEAARSNPRVVIHRVESNASTPTSSLAFGRDKRAIHPPDRYSPSDYNAAGRGRWVPY
jgi:hypothetical protein